MKASKLLTKDQRKKEYGDYVLIKNNAKKTVKGFNLTFEKFLTRTTPLSRSILKNVIR